MFTQPNPKHVESLLRFFESGCKRAGSGGFGVEIEHLPVHNSDDTAVTYYETTGIETLLMRLRPYYDESKEYWENGKLVGLGRDKLSISLEPGGQVETSLGVVHSRDELESIYRQFRAEADPITDELGFRLIQYGYQPKTSYADIPINPKARYAAMNEYFGRIGEFGPCMMRASGSTQVSIDYTSEEDAIRKLRVGSAIGPILAWFFRNTPYFEGVCDPWPLMRQRMWDYMDLQRTNLIPGLYNPQFSWATYAEDVLSTPLMFADLSHTPEALEDPDANLYLACYRENAAEIYPDRPLNDYEVNHVLSTHFNDVRLKNFIEMRHWDSLPIERAGHIMEIVGKTFYDKQRSEQVYDMFENVGEEDVLATKAILQAHSGEAKPYGRSMDFWHDFFEIDDAWAKIPGDPKHPNVFQTN